MLKILVAPAGYKGTIAAHCLAEAMARGCEDLFKKDIHHLYGEFELVKAPIADGGDDTLTSLIEVLGGELVESEVVGPTGQSLKAAYLKLPGNGTSTAVVELARASGIAYLKEGELAPLTAHTYGTGQLIARAIADGAKKIVIAIGGSASTDGGTGALAAMGAKFLDKDGQPVPLGGGGLSQIASIDWTDLLNLILGVEFVVATDVTSPLTGVTGAAAVFGPQKGANSDQVTVLDQGLTNLAEVVERSGQFHGLLLKMVAQSHAVGALIVGHDGQLVATAMPAGMDSEGIGIWALGVYMNSEHVSKKMKHDRVHQIILKTEQGYVVIADFVGGLLVSIEDSADGLDSPVPYIPGFASGSNVAYIDVPTPSLFMDQKIIEKTGRIKETGSEELYQGIVQVLGDQLLMLAAKNRLAGIIVFDKDGLPGRPQLLTKVDATVFSSNALAFYKSSEQAVKKMGFSKLYQIVAKTDLGYVMIADLHSHFLSAFTDEPSESPRPPALMPGAGAAGGAGFGFATMLGAEIVSGFHYLSNLLGLEQKLAWCDLVIVAEGKLDGQSLTGKGVGELISMAARMGKGIVALPACSELSGDELADLIGCPPDRVVLLPTAGPSSSATIDDVQAATAKALTKLL